MNFTERKHSSVFKPLIDEYILRIAQWANVDTEKVSNILNQLNAARYSQFEYLYTACRKVKSVLFIERVEVQLNYGYSRQLFNSPEINYVYAGETEYDYDPSDLESEDYAIVLENYPKKSHDALKQDKFWGGNAAEVVGIWKQKDGVEAVYKATPTEFTILGEDAIDYLEQIINAAFGGLPPYVAPLKVPTFSLPLIVDEEEEEQEEEDNLLFEEDFDAE